MQIVCPNCTTTYDVPAAKFGGEGRSVRCARCRTVWVATAAPEPAKKVAAPAAAMVADVEPRKAAVASAPSPAADEFPEAGEVNWSIGGPRPPDDAPAPGEDRPGNGRGAAARQDDIDAMWSAAAAEPVDPSPPLVPAMLPEADTDPVLQPENIETVAARRAGKAKGKKRGLRMKL